MKNLNANLLEVYNDNEKIKLKKTGNSVFTNLKSEHDRDEGDEDDAFVFENGETEEYKLMLNTLNKEDDKDSDSDRIRIRI